MTDEDKKAARYRKEAEDYLSPIPSPKESEKMRQQVEEERQRRLSKEAYDRADPMGKSIPPLDKKASGGSIRGSGCESKGKTKGRMV